MPVTLNFNNATATTSSAQIILTGSATVGLDFTEGVQIAGSFPFNFMSITQTSVSWGVAPGAAFNGTVALNVQTSASSPPILLVTNLSGMITVTYPTAEGPETLIVTIGEQITLSGYINV